MILDNALSADAISTIPASAQLATPKPYVTHLTRGDKAQLVFVVEVDADETTLEGE